MKLSYDNVLLSKKEEKSKEKLISFFYEYFGLKLDDLPCLLRKINATRNLDCNVKLKFKNDNTLILSLEDKDVYFFAESNEVCYKSTFWYTYNICGKEVTQIATECPKAICTA